MTALHWIKTEATRILLGHRTHRARRAAAFNAKLELERLESLQLLSHGTIHAALATHPIHAARTDTAATKAESTSMTSSDVMAAQATQPTVQTITYTATVPATLTNFGVPAMPPLPAIPPVPFSPAIPLFNSSLGTLVAVTTSTVAQETSQIKSQNLSTLSGTTITGFVNGTFSVAGLNQTVSGTLASQTQPFNAAPFGGTVNYQPPSGVTFPPLTATSNQSKVFTSPTDLAFFTASGTNTSVTPTLSASATAGANAPNGNLSTQVSTSAQATITVTYAYVPTMACPPATGVTRFGVHHQPTQLVVQFAPGTIDPAQAQNPANYKVIAPGKDKILGTADDITVPIASAVLNNANNTVTLTTAERLNVHYHYKLVVSLPCYTSPITLDFGTKLSLGGFRGHQGQFIPVTNGHLGI